MSENVRLYSNFFPPKLIALIQLCCGTRTFRNNQIAFLLSFRFAFEKPILKKFQRNFKEILKKIFKMIGSRCLTMMASRLKFKLLEIWFKKIVLLRFSWHLLFVWFIWLNHSQKNLLKSNPQITIVKYVFQLFKC